MGDMTPFAMLEELAERSEAGRQALPTATAAQTLWAGLGFTLLGQRFVAPMEEVAEVMRIPQLTRLPGVKPFVYGVSNVRGRLMAVLDLAMFVGRASEFSRANRRVLAIESDETFIGFIIDESLGMQHFPSDTYEDAVQEVDESFRDYVRGGYRLAGSYWPILSLTALSGHKDLQKLAASS